MQKTETKSAFENFTNLYELSKTLKFELKPVPRTKKLLGLENKDVFLKDKERAENYAIIKTYIDRLHTKFINAALALPEAHINVSDFSKGQENMENSEEISDEQENSENDDNEGREVKSRHHKKIISLFNYLNKADRIEDSNKRFKGWVNVSKNEVSGNLFSKELINILNNEFKDELDTDIAVPVLFFNKDKKGSTRKLREVFNSFGKDGDGNGQDFTTYFSSAFHNNRKNYYKADGKAGRVATRIIDENLKRFISNKEKFEDIQKGAENNNSEQLQDSKKKIKKINLVKKYKELLTKFNAQSDWVEFKSKKTKQEELPADFDFKNWKEYAFGNKYEHFLQNKINGYNFIIGKLNKDINELNVDLTQFLRLHKQVHGEVKKQDEEFEVGKDNILSSGDSFIKKFIKHSETKLKFSRKIFSIFLNEEFSDSKNVFLSNRAITTISNKCFVSWHTFGGEILDYFNRKNKKQIKKLPDFVDLQIIIDVLNAANNASFQDLFKNKYFEKIDLNNKQREHDRERLEKLRRELKNGEHWNNFLHIIRFEFDSLVELHNDTANKLLIETVYKKGNKNYSRQEQEKQVGLLFDFAESANGILNMTKYFALRKKGVMIEDKKYANRNEIHEQVEIYLDGDDINQEKCLINQYYKALKNFVTKKPWMEDKIALNFDKSQFLGGWPQSQEKVKGGVILRKKQDSSELYYLAILGEKDKTFFENKDLYNAKGSIWQKMVYTQLQNPSRMLPKIFITPFLTKNDDKNKTEENWNGIDRKQSGAKDKMGIDINPTDEILNGYIQGKHKKQKGVNPNVEFLQKYFDFLKSSIEKYYNRKFNFPNTKEFKDTSLFYAWAEENVYNIEFIDINEQLITDLVVNLENKKKVYLFQVYNKDFELDEEIGKEKYGDNFLAKKEWRNQKERKEEEKEQGRENLETSFFKLLFDPRNLKNEKGVVYKLSGGAKMFYRSASENLNKKKIKDQNGQEKEIFDRQRYKENKLFLNVPIVMNFVNKKEGYKINGYINKIIAQTPFGQDKFRIIALDRGEKHLAYLTVLNEKGKILEMKSLNNIERFDKFGNPILEKNQYHDKDGKSIGKPKFESFKNYQNLLDQREIERLKARKSWEQIEKIADLKEGYLGFVSNIISNLAIKAIKENKIPIIVLEDLNAGMKQGRIKIEKQVYSKVEEKIAKKLNYLIDKKLGNFFNAWQLTPKIETFGGNIEDRNQVGIIFYVNPGYTSAICPACGFRRRKYIKPNDAKAEFKNIEINFEGIKYEFKDSLEAGSNNGGIHPIGTVVYSNVRRVIWNKHENNGRGDKQEIADVTTEFTKLFKEFGIDNLKDINKQIQELNFLDKEQEKMFWVRLCKWFHCVLEVRNSINKKRNIKEDNANSEIEEWGENRDFINCPHCYFDSEDDQKWNKLKEKIYIGSDSQSLKFNGDANGAYNIGRKGIIAIERIKEYQEELENFKKTWNIQNLPKKDEKNIITKNEKKFIITILYDEKKQPNYCVLETKNEDFKSIPLERKTRCYPDLFISDNKWDDATKKWAKNEIK